MGLWSPVTRRCFRQIFIFWRVSCVNSDSGECTYDAKFAFIESMCHFCEIWCTHTGRTVQMAAWQKKTNEIQQVWLTLRITDLDPPFPSRSGVAISRDLIRHNFPWFHQSASMECLDFEVSWGHASKCRKISTKESVCCFCTPNELLCYFSIAFMECLDCGPSGELGCIWATTNRRISEAMRWAWPLKDGSCSVAYGILILWICGRGVLHDVSWLTWKYVK